MQKSHFPNSGSDALTEMQTIANVSRRGYTGHEHMDNLGLINMNGRIQDPHIGRFLSADPLIQAPEFSQSLNRYSYVWNNPLSMVDPSGFTGSLIGGCNDVVFCSSTQMWYDQPHNGKVEVSDLLVQFNDHINNFYSNLAAAGSSSSSSGGIDTAFVTASRGIETVHLVGLTEVVITAATERGVNPDINIHAAILQADVASSTLTAPMDNVTVEGTVENEKPSGWHTFGRFMLSMVPGFDLAACAFSGCSKGEWGMAALAAIPIPAVKVGVGGVRALFTVYRSVNGAKTVYVGITNSLARRAAEHLRGKGILIEKIMGGLSRSDARAVEQVLIQINGLGKNGGTLMNQINSISKLNPNYASQLERGYELLRSIGY